MSININTDIYLYTFFFYFLLIGKVVKRNSGGNRSSFSLPATQFKNASEEAVGSIIPTTTLDVAATSKKPDAASKKPGAVGSHGEVGFSKASNVSSGCVDVFNNAEKAGEVAVTTTPLDAATSKKPDAASKKPGAVGSHGEVGFSKASNVSSGCVVVFNNAEKAGEVAVTTTTLDAAASKKPDATSKQPGAVGSHGEVGLKNDAVGGKRHSQGSVSPSKTKNMKTKHAIVTSTAGERCKVSGLAIDGNPILEALDDDSHTFQSASDESKSGFDSGTDISEALADQTHREESKTDDCNSDSHKEIKGQMVATKIFYKYSSAVRCGVKAKCPRCMNLYVKGSSKLKHTKSCPSTTCAVDSTWDSNSDISLILENFSPEKDTSSEGSTTEMNYCKSNAAFTDQGSQSVNPSLLNLSYDNESMDDDILNESPFSNTTNIKQSIVHPSTYDLEDNVDKTIDYRENINTNVQEMLTIQAAPKKDKTITNIDCLSDEVVKKNNQTVTLLDELSRKYNFETRYLTDAESLFFREYEWSDLFIKAMYDQAFHNANFGELASHYVPYVEDAIEEKNPLLRYFEFDFLYDDDATISTIWVDNIFIKKVSNLCNREFQFI